MAEESKDTEIQADRKISVDSLTDGDTKKELTAPGGSLSAGILAMVREYLKPELDGIKARLAILEKQ
jgi:hypothetical protein